MGQVEEYFYGVRRELSPASTTLPISDLQVFRVGGGPRAPSSALPLGTLPSLGGQLFTPFASLSRL